MASDKITLPSPRLSSRNVAMRHDRPDGDEARDRGRSGRGELGSHRSSSPRRHQDGDGDRDTNRGRPHRGPKGQPSSAPPPPPRIRSPDRPRDAPHEHHGRGRPRDPSPRRFDPRRDLRDDGFYPPPHAARPPSPPPPPPRGPRSALDARPLSPGRKRRRSPSPSRAPSRRKKSKKEKRDRAKHLPPPPQPRDGREPRRPSYPRRLSERGFSPPRGLPRHRDEEGGDYDFYRGRDPHWDDANPAPRHGPPSPRERDSQPRHDRPRPPQSDDFRGYSSPRRPISPDWDTRPPLPRRSRDSSPSRPVSGQLGPRRRSPRGGKRKGRGPQRDSGATPAGTGANSIEVNMSARGGSFRGGFSQQPPGHLSSRRSQYGNDHSRSNYSQSPTPNPSYHNSSPASQSSYPSGRSGWNGPSQLSPSQQRHGPPTGPPTGPSSGAQGQGHYYSNSSHSPPHSAPTGPMSQQYQGNYRGGNYRGGSASYRGGQFNSTRGSYRSPGFKQGQWSSANPGGPRSSSGSGNQQPAPQESNAAKSQTDESVKGSNSGGGSGSQKDEETDKASRPPEDNKAEDIGSEPSEAKRETQKTDPNPPATPVQNGETSSTQTPARQPPSGPAASKFSFAFNKASKPTPTAPKPEISQKFNAAPQKQPPTQPASHNQPHASKERDHHHHHHRDRDRDFPRSAPTEPASARAARRNVETAPRPPRTRKVKKKMRRPVARPKLEPELVTSTSIFYRKPGNESVVGSGTYGKVFKGLNVYTKNSVALKRIRMEGERDGFPVTAVREVKLLQSLRHVNIVELIEVMVERNDCFMVFEYLAHDLTGILNHPTFKLDDGQRKDLSKQLFEGLDYLHIRGVLHRDIKAANILVSKEGVLKLADFGLARFYAKRHQLDYTNRVVTIWYRSPELLLGETQYGPACDVWSAACVMMEIFVRSAVFPGDGTEMNQLDRIYSVMGTPTKADWPGIVDMAWFELLRPGHRVHSVFADKYRDRLSPKAYELVRGMFRYDPDKRPTASQVLEHEYFTTEEPRPRQARELQQIDGDWHEFESKALRRENERKEKEARRARESQSQSQSQGQGQTTAAAGGGNSTRDKDRERKRAPEAAADEQRDTKRQHTEASRPVQG